MTFIIFFIILGVLIFVHELGHFLFAKWAKVRVDEFGFGYPPRALKIGTKWGTLFSLNWIPFGGFVKIYGENYEEEENQGLPEKAPAQEVLGSPCSTGQTSLAGLFPAGKNFTQVSKKWQSAILVAGVLFNVIFAWFLISIGFMIGLPTSLDNEMSLPVENPKLMITQVINKSPAEKVGLKSGDKINKVENNAGEILKELNPEEISKFIGNSKEGVKIYVDRGGEMMDFYVMPEENIKERKIIGISTDTIGTLKLPFFQSLYYGLKTTINITSETVTGLLGLIKNSATGNADMSQISGPVGIVRIVSDASKLGFVYLLTFTALISINLAVINIFPFPALDGGRILFVIIEAITNKKINARVATIINSVGIIILMSLMVFITFKDIIKLF